MLNYVKICSKTPFCYCKTIECRGSGATFASQVPKSITKIRKTSLSKCVSSVDVANGDPKRRFFNQIPVDVWFSGLPSCSFFGPLIRNRHHHGGFVFFDRAIWLRAVELRSPSSWCFLLLLVVTSRSAIAIIMVFLFSVVCLPVVLRSPSSWWFFSGSLACSVLSSKPFLAKCVRKWYHFY